MFVNGGANGDKWKPEYDEMLTSLVLTGELSYSGIMKKINAKFRTNFSRNAIAGRVARLGLKSPTDAAMTERKPVTKKKRVRIVQSKGGAIPRLMDVIDRDLPRLKCAEIAPKHVTLLELGSGCKYPYGDGPFTFCGHPRLDGLPYCLPHQALCWKGSER